MEWLSNPEAWIALLTLTVLEVVLGLDNVIFISILSGKLPPHQQKKARTIGLAMAMIMRVLLLLSLAWIVRLTSPLFTILGQEISGSHHQIVRHRDVNLQLQRLEHARRRRRRALGGRR